MKRLEKRIKRGEVIILDGGTGTELEKRGVPMNGDAWNGAAFGEGPRAPLGVRSRAPGAREPSRRTP